MNLTPSASREYAQAVLAHCNSAKDTSVWVAPSVVALSAVAQVFSDSTVSTGSQNIHWAESGAFTGELAPASLKELGVTWALAGHSERRSLFAEDSNLVAKRVNGAATYGITPVLCVGETEQEREENRTSAVLASQLLPVLTTLPESSRGSLVIAYEPVWAIGTGKVATTAEVRDAHAYIKGYCLENGFTIAPPVLYGGSVNPSNYAEIVATEGVDGALVGGASLKIEQWLELLRISESA